MRTLGWIRNRDNALATAANVILILDSHCLDLPKSEFHLYNHTIGKRLRFFTFPDTDFVLQSETKHGTIATHYDKVPCSVLLSSRRTPSCRSVSFSFLFYVLLSKNRSGLHPKAPSSMRLARLTFAREVLRSLILCKTLFPQLSFAVIHT